MDPELHAAVELFNAGRFSDFQDTLESFISNTRAASERQFLALLDNLAEVLLQLGDGDLDEAREILQREIGKLDEFVPRFRGLNTEALREDFRRLLVEMRAMKPGDEQAPSRLPRLRVLAD
jgi:hypothetical protein